MHKVRSPGKAGIELLIRHCSLSIVLLNAIILTINIVIFHQLIPILLNYPSDYAEYLESFAIIYWVQYMILGFLCIAFTSVFTYLSLRDIDSWHKIPDSDTPEREERLSAIRRKCLSLPYRLYLYQIIIPVPILFIYSVIFSAAYEYSISSFLYIILIVMTFFSLTALINFLLVKKIFNEILCRIGIYSRLEGKRISLRYKMMHQILPISVVSILFTSMLGYSRLIEDRGNFLFRLYRGHLEDSFSGVPVRDIGDIESRLRDIDVDGTKAQHFILKPDGELIASDGSPLNRYFLQYMQSFSDAHGGRVYDETIGYNGAAIKITNDTGTWTAGVRYRLSSDSAIYYLGGNFIILILITMSIIYLSSRSITSDISAVAAFLEEIAAGWNIKSRKRIPITSNDEIGELVLAINRIRDCEHEYDMLKSEFIANISHEFRTPLNIILNALQLSVRYIRRSSNEEDASRLSAHMNTMRQNCYRLLKLINNMIDSTKLEANFFKLYRQNCNIVSDIRFLAMSVADFIRAKEVNLVFEANTDKKIIAVDPDAIERIMLNLLANAVKFSKKGSTITVGVADRGDSVEISVRDTGIGIPEEKLQSIFKRFTQVGSTLRKDHEGSGIGLSIVKSLVEMHRGVITVNSKQGEGSEFIISLPVEILPIQLEGEGEWEHYENKLQSGIEKIDIEFSDI